MLVPAALEPAAAARLGRWPEKTAFMDGPHAPERPARPEELARSVLNFASDDSATVTGTASPVDGGASIART